MLRLIAWILQTRKFWPTSKLQNEIHVFEGKITHSVRPEHLARSQTGLATKMSWFFRIHGVNVFCRGEKLSRQQCEAYRAFKKLSFLSQVNICIPRICIVITWRWENGSQTISSICCKSLINAISDLWLESVRKDPISLHSPNLRSSAKWYEFSIYCEFLPCIIVQVPVKVYLWNRSCK